MRTPRSELENLRIQKLHEYLILDTSPEQTFDDIVSLATQICGTPFALITLVDSDREWFKAKKGITANENPRNGGFCSQTILQQDVIVVANADNDNRFSTNALVTSAPNIRFYAGAPVRTPTGEALGTLCVLDTVLRELSEEQIEALRALARQVGVALELRRKEFALVDTLAEAKHTEHFMCFQQCRECRFRQVVESVPNAIVMVNESGTMLMVNRQTEMSFGYSRTELIGQPLEILVPERFRSGLIGFRQAYFADPQSKPIGASRELYGLRNDGSEFPVEIGLSLIDSHDEILFLSSIVDLTTERKRLEYRFRQAVESAPNAIIMVNESGTMLMVNRQTETSFGYSNSELIGQPLEILVPERFRNGLIGFRHAPQSKPVSASCELYGLRKDGSEFPVEISVGLIDSREETLVLSTIVDITERKRANDKLKQALNEKEMLLKEVYHRVKNNLQVVSSLINLQARNVKNETAADLLKQSADRIKAMALLHENLYQSKDLAKIDFNEYIHSLIDHLLFGYAVNSEKITISMSIDDVFLDVDTAIPCGLIINELLSNALTHAFPDDRHGKIGITFTQDQGQTSLVFTDNGIGFPSDLDFKKSASLGLQLVATLTSQLMGQMILDQTDGSTFTIRFTTIA